ncbi:TnsA-like heteromeric transposase endonuclease subunit [Cellulomonas xiejunii]|uniref:TnsA-like heteromeric transposase endonuclease subunit n=1 Tax=Cellulomonas xiejunii TaxID=2968083 RepID=UPI001D0E3D9F|nr:TnsA-like heteromeric transposase endonuclease subunit [Cellulomonas xiejunii]MCC2313555.1 TnsA-like heteromeric transposase endonuclease subunit [Cellulomonas xiejunii]
MDRRWEFATESCGRVVWDWAGGSPTIEHLVPVRRPSSRARSRHVPAKVYSMMTGGWLLAESGLEHDLIRVLDRQPDVRWIVAQPLRLEFVYPDRRFSHIPDVLSVRGDSVTVWDCRPASRHDDAFIERTTATKAVCAEVGWSYEVFVGQPLPERMNERWLAGFRRSRPWHDDYRHLVLAACATPVTLAELISSDDGSGKFVETIWHLICVGELVCDLDTPLRRATRVRSSSDA